MTWLDKTTELLEEFEKKTKEIINEYYGYNEEGNYDEHLTGQSKEDEK